LSPSPTTTSLADIASVIVNTQNQNPIMWLQGALNGTVGANLDVDGDFGPLTEGALLQLLSRFLNQQESGTMLSAIKILLSKA
jgi:lysozyme family protein